MARTSDRREFLMLAHVYDPKKHYINGWFYSEKLDGMRAFWDGGITRGLYCDEIPFANVAKDGRLVTRPKSSGLWSRYGKPIQAPLWFLDQLPAYPLDGELHAGRGKFQQTMSTVRKIDPVDSEWEYITYQVFDLPDYSMVFQDGRLSTPNFEKRFHNVLDWLKNQRRLTWDGPKLRRFETVQHLLRVHHGEKGPVVRAVEQTQLPFQTDKIALALDAALESVLSQGGEGLIVRAPGAVWEPQRLHSCLKVKPFEDAEVTVTGYISGRETDRGSKLLGLMGAMIVDFNGKRLELSGFTDSERVLCYGPGSREDAEREARQWCVNNPGQTVPEGFCSLQFPIGSKITIKYRELTNDGLPKEARYFRPRPEE